MKNILILIVCLLATLVTACSNFIPAYKIDIQQGNILDQNDINQVKLGMSRRKISYILGTPIITDPFHVDRWDYAYSMKYGSGKFEKRNISLYFENNILIKTTGTIKPLPISEKEQANYQKQVVLVVNPPKKESPGVFKRIWNSFFGNEADYDQID